MHAHFGGTARHSLGGAAPHFFVRQYISRPAQILGAALRKSTKSAAVQTDVGVIDVAVDDICHRLARRLHAQRIGCADNAVDIWPFCRKQRDNVTLAQPFARARDDLLDCGRCQSPTLMQDCGRRCLPAGAPVLDHRQSTGIDRTSHCGRQCAIQPQVGFAGKGGADCQSFDELAPGCRGRFGQRVKMRPRCFGVHVVGCDRRYAAPVVDPGSQQLRQPVGLQIGRRLDRHRPTQDQPRDGDCPQMVIQRRFGMIGHARARLGPEILDDHFLNVAVAAVQVADCDQRVDPFGARFADADQNAGGKRYSGTSRRVDCREAYCRGLVG